MDVEKKLTLSLDDLIAEQRKPERKKPAAKKAAPKSVRGFGEVVDQMHG